MNAVQNILSIRFVKNIIVAPLVLMLCFFSIPQPLQSGSKFMKASPLVFHSHNISIPKRWRSITSYPGFIDRKEMPDNTMRAYSVADVPEEPSKMLVVLNDKYGQLANPLNAVVNLRLNLVNHPPANFRDITKDMDSLSLTPSHFLAVSPNKVTRPNVLYHRQITKIMDAFFVTYQPKDVNLPLEGALHCTYSNATDVFDYFQVNVGNVSVTTLGDFMNDICEIIENQLN